MLVLKLIFTFFKELSHGVSFQYRYLAEFILEGVKLKSKWRLLTIIIFCLLIDFQLAAQQINIPRIEQMPNIPVPYEMRDWNNVAIGIIFFVLVLVKTGNFLLLF